MSAAVIALFANIMAPPPPMPLEWRVIAEGQTGGFERETCFLLINQESYRELWTKLNGPTLVAAPEVDHDSSLVLAVFLGKRPSLGYGIGITAIEFEEFNPFNFHFFRNLGTIRVFADEVCPEDPRDGAGAHPWVLVEVKAPKMLLNEEALRRFGVNVKLSLRRCKI